MISPLKRQTGGARQHAGVIVLAVSLGYSAFDLLGWLRPLLLRWRAHTGVPHTAAIVLGSLTFKALILIAGMLLAFWPARRRKPVLGTESDQAN
jgi:hypothetical protein